MEKFWIGKEYVDDALEWTKKGGAYPRYKKGSRSAVKFNKEFATAEKAGKKNFMFQGRKYEVKTNKMNRGGKVKAAYERMYKAKWGG